VNISFYSGRSRTGRVMGIIIGMAMNLFKCIFFIIIPLPLYIGPELMMQNSEENGPLG